MTVVDSDRDSLTDFQEDANLNGLRDAGETSTEHADTDGDSTPDGVELKTGTDPLDPSSFFLLITPFFDAPDQFVVKWPSKPGALYRLESSDSPEGPWDLVEDDVPAHAHPADTTSYGLVPAGSRAFFRVILQQKKKGQRHHAILRGLAFKWIRIIHRCWQSGRPYDESHAIDTFKKRSSPLVPIIQELLNKQAQSV